MEYALELHGLCKQYPGFTLGPLDLTLPMGSILGFIGENGAGKSTTIKAALGLVRPDGGSVRLLGKDPEQDRSVLSQVGVVLDAGTFPPEMNGRQLSRTLSGVYPSWDQEGFFRRLERFQIPLDKKVKAYSRGMAMKCSLAAAMSHGAKLLLLDEHTAALDPKTAAKVLTLSDQIVEENGLTTLMITHNMKDAIQHGNRLIMMDAGRVVVDISGEEKKKLTVPDLLALFSRASGSEEADDKLLLS